jgi:DNA-binding Xre family transcriptional regulator
MIKSNLKVKLAENNIRISKIANDTGISRTTLTALSEGHTKGIQFDTLNKICRYLKIEPADLFVYSPIDIIPKIQSLKLSNVDTYFYSDNNWYVGNADISTTLFLNIETDSRKFSVECNGTGIIVDDLIQITLTTDDDIKGVQDLDKIYNELPRELQVDLERIIGNLYEDYLKSFEFETDAYIATIPLLNPVSIKLEIIPF